MILHIGNCPDWIVLRIKREEVGLSTNHVAKSRSKFIAEVLDMEPESSLPM